jgi:Fungal Zn(2)-Cys(6) binuclear cluster domain
MNHPLYLGSVDCPIEPPATPVCPQLTRLSPAGAPFVRYVEPARMKRGLRTALACHACRSKKTKCDGRQPTCRSCEESNRTCSYREKFLVPKPRDRLTDVEMKIEAIAESVAQLHAYQTKEKDRWRRFDDLLQRFEKTINTTSGPAPSNHGPQPEYPTSEPKAGSSHKQDQTCSHNISASIISPTAKMSKPILGLLEWPSLRHLLPQNFNSAYVWKAEVERKSIHTSTLTDNDIRSLQTEARDPGTQLSVSQPFAPCRWSQGSPPAKPQAATGSDEHVHERNS